MVILNEKIWGLYDIDFPLEKDLSIIIGYNGSGKTTVLNHLNDYLLDKGENVLYFKEQRHFNLDYEKVYEMLRAEQNLKKLFNKEDFNNLVSSHHLNIEELFLKESFIGHSFISNGKHQLVNFFCNIKSLKEPATILIDLPETNIDSMTRKYLLDFLFNLKNTKKLIVVTHCPMIASSIYKDHIIDIENIIKKH